MKKKKQETKNFKNGWCEVVKGSEGPHFCKWASKQKGLVKKLWQYLILSPPPPKKKWKNNNNWQLFFKKINSPCKKKEKKKKLMMIILSLFYQQRWDYDLKGFRKRIQATKWQEEEKKNGECFRQFSFTYQ